MSPYTTPDIDYFWSDEYTLGQWANVERALLAAQAEHHQVPIEWAEEAALTPAPDLDRWEYHKSKTRHEFVAFLDAWALEHVHLGVTSSDIIDTAHALRYRAINDHISTDAYRLREALLTFATDALDRPRLGRTHGQAAIPTTFGHRYADLCHQVDRGAHRLTQARRDLEVGMLNGPTGGHHHIYPETERLALEILGLQPAPATTQIIARDSLTHYAATLIGLIETTAALAMEIRLGTHQAIAEYSQAVPPGYIGSSAMPHKRNPSDAERITGLARIARQAYPALAESVEQWHERDISQSSVERVLMPQLTGIAHYCLRWAHDALHSLQIEHTVAEQHLTKATEAGSHMAMVCAQKAGMSYLDARVAANKRPTPAPLGPEIAHARTHLNRLGSRPKE
jgi:adenylosuccinate lyase